MLIKVKRFSTRQKIFETEAGVTIEPINNNYNYFRTPEGVYVEGILSELTKKELAKNLKTTEVTKTFDASIGKQMLEKHFEKYTPTSEANKAKWTMTLANLMGIFNENYKDQKNLEKLYKKVFTENFVEFLSFSDKDFKDLTVDELLKHQVDCKKKETECYTYTRLKQEFHFTDKMIKSLLPAPILVKNPNYSSGAPMKLYRKKVVLQVMQTEQYKTRLTDYQKWKEKAGEREERKKQLRLAREEEWRVALTKLDLTDYYPKARSMQRHFILHLGPTNSGKTFEALEDFRSNPNSVYLAPLRLLAQEVAEDTNEQGVLCTMETGEERAVVEGANHWSQTIELLDFDKEYEVAVIDEGQKISDQQRGGAWTEAIMGICAKRIHICSPAYAKNDLINLIERCGDTYEIVKHERLTHLSYTSNKKPYEKGDAFIVFSRRAVYEVAEQMKNKGYSVSILYGAMPYDVKQYEAKQFREGNTDILISTDCIGMGMNLPIKTIRFLEIKKYDGYDVRELRPEEMQQIAGRAGRYGVYPEGYYTGPSKTQNIFSEVPFAHCPKVKYPRNIYELNGKLSEILEYWQDNIEYNDYGKQDCEELIEKVVFLEKETKLTDNKEILKYASVPFDIKYYEMWQYWYECVICAIHGDVPPEPYLYNGGIEELEASHKLLDIYCHFVYNNDQLLNEGLALKQKISKEIMEEIERNVRTQKEKPKLSV